VNEDIFLYINLGMEGLILTIKEWNEFVSRSLRS
jgi:hypothetical protein